MQKEKGKQWTKEMYKCSSFVISITYLMLVFVSHKKFTEEKQMKDK